MKEQTGSLHGGRADNSSRDTGTAVGAVLIMTTAGTAIMTAIMADVVRSYRTDNRIVCLTKEV